MFDPREEEELIKLNNREFLRQFYKNHETRKSWGSQLEILVDKLDWELHATIIRAVFKKLKIDAILTVDHTVSSIGEVHLRFLPEKVCYGINLQNGTIEPIYKILNSNNPRDYLPDYSLNIIIANSLEKSNLIDILKIKPIDLIKEMLEYNAGEYGGEVEEYGWAILGIKNKKIYREYLPLWRTEIKNEIITMANTGFPFDDDTGEILFPNSPEKKYILESISGNLGNTDRVGLHHEIWNDDKDSKFRWTHQHESVMHKDDRWKILCN